MQDMRWTLAFPLVVLGCSFIREDPRLQSPSNPEDPAAGGSSAGGSSQGGRGGAAGEGGGAGAAPFVIEQCACAVSLVEADNSDCRICADSDSVSVDPDCEDLRNDCAQRPGCAALLGPQFFCTGPSCLGLMEALPADELQIWADYVDCICAVTECRSACEPISVPQDAECVFTL
jgi:hypothetical protein